MDISIPLFNSHNSIKLKTNLGYKPKPTETHQLYDGNRGTTESLNCYKNKHQHT